MFALCEFWATWQASRTTRTIRRWISRCGCCRCVASASNRLSTSTERTDIQPSVWRDARLGGRYLAERSVGGMPTRVRGESVRRLRASARLSDARSASDPSVQRSRVAVRTLSGVPRSFAERDAGRRASAAVVRLQEDSTCGLNARVSRRCHETDRPAQTLVDVEVARVLSWRTR